MCCQRVKWNRKSWIRFEKRLGVLPATDLKAIKAALAKACAL
jgi:hypothetical protein